ncbi:MAG: BrnA antitoxin family protein, partial [Hyphomicrobiales bacterium]|nr:BrnA antitoxin family protein [Hyphomicrobiales bacterium]
EEQERLNRARIDYSDIPPLGDEFFSKAKQVLPPAKQQVTIRLDSDVLEWLRRLGRGYQTRINLILRAAMESPRGHSQTARPRSPRTSKTTRRDPTAS